MWHGSSMETRKDLKISTWGFSRVEADEGGPAEEGVVAVASRPPPERGSFSVAVVREE